MKIRTLLISVGLALATALAGCTTGAITSYSSSYGSKRDAGYRLPTIPIYKVKKKYHRQLVRYETKEKPGTIIVETSERHLYFVMEDGRAMRYGIGIGREGFEWSGTARVANKRQWPVWTPPAAMIRRQPELAKYRKGMRPGLKNPLGARALYLHNKRGDTGYRLHGSPEWWSIGQSMSSGCIRLMNQDIIDLHERVKIGAKVIVR